MASQSHKFDDPETIQEKTVLTERQAKFFYLAYVKDEHLTSEQIGEKLGVEAGTVRGRLKRCRDKIKSAEEDKRLAENTCELSKHLPIRYRDTSPAEER
jgi:predicted DNA-binding protein YlxM (UPF0122 family)